MSVKRQTLWSMAPLLVVTVLNLVSIPLFYRFLGADLYALMFYVASLSGSFGFADLGLGDWRSGLDASVFALKRFPVGRANVELISGWFNETLPGFMPCHRGPIKFLHVDCDLYSSTRDWWPTETLGIAISDRIAGTSKSPWKFSDRSKSDRESCQSTFQPNLSRAKPSFAYFN